MYGLEFEWDSHKDTINQSKHGFSFQQARYAFFDPFGLTLADPTHSDEEIRFLRLAFLEGKLVTVSFTQREQRIRIINCRGANRKERKIYEQSYDS